MPLDVQRNQVTAQVRREALRLQQFTAEEIAKTTKQNVSSIHTAIHRLVSEGYLIPEVLKNDSDKPSRRGRPQTRYHLTPDPNKRIELHRSIAESDPARMSPPRPTSAHYFQAREKLYEAQNTASSFQRSAALEEAQELLELADQEENWVLAPESVRVYLRFERTRLLFLQKQYEAAENDFQRLLPYVQKINDPLLEDMTKEFVNLAAYIQQELKPNFLGLYATQQPTDPWLNEEMPSQSPVACFLREALRRQSPVRATFYSPFSSIQSPAWQGAGLWDAEDKTHRRPDYAQCRQILHTNADRTNLGEL